MRVTAAVLVAVACTRAVAAAAPPPRTLGLAALAALRRDGGEPLLYHRHVAIIF